MPSAQNLIIFGQFSVNSTLFQTKRQRMRSLFTLLFGLIIGTLSFAQPANDDCNGRIDLGVLPACTGAVFTNAEATASNIGTRNSPTCFNGSTTQRDVWFSFTTSSSITDITISVRGESGGASGRALANPQIAVYRGDCSLNGLSEIGCISAPNGSDQVRLDVFGLSPGTTYFLRVNDYSATAAPNSGDFSVCIQQYVAAINMGEASGSNACFGTLYDSGGPDGDYDDFEDYTFTICPTEPHSCIEIDLLNFDIEPVLLNIFGDVLRFYAGDNTSAPLIAEVYGQDIGTPFKIQAKSPCITVEFQSDFLVAFPGFELTWQCSSEPCENRSLDNPVEITALPFAQSGLSTCESAATFAETPCVNDVFLNGPEYVFTYNSLGGTCISVEVANAIEGTGVLILSGPPSDSATTCIARGTDGTIASANLRNAGTYYIVVANAGGCTPFDLKIEETTCSLSPALVDALCNPLNGCVRLDGLPTIFDFEDGFQDIEIQRDVNNGCWLGFGVEPNFYWFTIQSQADGPFGFILDSADPQIPSDLDFNVWGPFTQEEVCGNKDEVIAFIRNNQPIRSSWSPTPGATGLADRHPIFGTPVTDNYDCGDEPGADGDDFVRTIPTRRGEVYVVLINDWGNLIGEEGVAINWSPSNPAVLEQIPAVVEAGDTSICAGESVQISISSAVNAITWLNDTNTLSCDNCPNPVAMPLKTTVYRALVDAVCYNDTLDVTVEVYDVDAGPDVTVCRGEQFEIIAGSSFADATWQWNVPDGINFSCTNCPNPTVIAPNPGVYTVTVALNAPICTLRDTVVITVRSEQAPQYVISNDLEICRGESVNLGGAANTNTTYNWSSNPVGFTSSDANPRVTPQQTTTYLLNVSTPACPITKLDSVTITVYVPPVLNVAADTSVCQEQPVLLGIGQPEADVVYEWRGPQLIDNPSDYNTLAFPASLGNYTLIATRGTCEVRDTVQVNITPIDIDILTNGQDLDTIRLCRGDELNLTAFFVPNNAQVVWSPDNGTLSDTIGMSVIAKPQTKTTYVATVTVDACIRVDSIVVLVDSLPANLAIMPGDTSICEGSLVILKSPTFEPKDFMDIKFLWQPGNGQQTPDSLYNMVIQGDTTTRYFRTTTNGVCVDTAYADIMVKPIPQLEIIPSDTTVCPGEQLKYQVIRPDGVTKPMWMPPNGLSCTECFDPIATGFNTIQYQFSAELDGCPGSASATLNVFPTPLVNLNARTQICRGETIQLNAAFTPGATYTWTSSTDPNFRSNDPLLEVAPTENTTYNLVAEIGGCDPVEASITITVVQPADVNVSANQTICQGESVTLTANGTAPDGVNETYLWRWNGQTSNQSTITVNNLTDDTQFELIYIYGENCGVVRKTVNVAVEESVIIDEIVVEPEAYLVEGVPAGDAVTLTVLTTPANPVGASYVWTANGQPIGSNNPQVQDEPVEDPTLYKVSITSPNGCISMDSISLTVIPPQHIIPNAFTPNGDGRNDFFNVVAKGQIEIVEFRVYNRWGQLVYDNEDPNRGWDGKHNGNPAPADVYVYYIVIRYPDGQEFTERGDVTLIR